MSGCSASNLYLVEATGTSYSTPHAAGVVALMLSKAKALGLTLTPGIIKAIIKSTATDLGDPGTDAHYSHGGVDAGAAVAKVGNNK
jgi:subtilisin family serine protease